ncbi:hypothetical protein [Paenibacillus xylanilyticus]|uniref:Uncharacterized protein n=1 Tax=Paenibacillus xylanilyticus TaxID=248903 RepID=A0A7Y6BU73_9BACL|nr:hypothetical protein [Paenibacillus xylanilyticus]NUU74506.1 hypothetical protein [Paenibacillus xylanilyticus]
MKRIAESEGTTLQGATRLIVYVTDMYRSIRFRRTGVQVHFPLLTIIEEVD